MSLRKSRHIPELYDLKHRSDNLSTKPMDIENNILKKTMSGHIFENNNMNNFLLKFQKMVFIMVDQMFIMKNFKNFMVDKYYNDHLD